MTTSPYPQGAPSPARKPPLPALTGLRTLLAVNIMFFHFTPPHMQLLSPFMENGFVFVGFFFLLSGYVLAYNYSDRALTLNPRNFWVARFARLYPIYLVGLLLSFQMFQAEWQVRTHFEFAQGVLLTPILLQGWSPLLATFWNTVGWTLSSELLLYAAFPWVIRTWTLRLPHLNTSARLIALFLVLWFAGMVPHTIYLLLNPDHLTEPANRYTYAYWLRALKYTPPSYICMFLAGITLGKLQLLLSLTHRQRFLLAGAALAAIATFFYTAVAHVPYVLMHAGLLLPLFAALTIGLSGAHPIASVLSWRPILKIGETTFCLYILHFNGINLLRNFHVWERLHLASLDPWITYATALALAFAAHHLIEKPARRLLLNRLSSKPAA
jgi:peptidoglycan/LPS O-acetylase OafA/YrhL